MITHTTRQMAIEMTAMIDLVRPSIVGVGGQRGFGAGIVWSDRGLIITNDHVAENNQPLVQLSNGMELQGRVVARDGRNDLAAIQLDTAGLVEVTQRSSDDVRVGELVIALGHPLGLKEAPTLGMISGIGEASWMGAMRRDLIQVDVSLAPGNSGGPIVDASARVVGIACMIASPGMALVIPTRIVQRFVDALKRRKKTAA